MNDGDKIMNKSKLFTKTNQQVLNFLCKYPNDSFYSNQIAQKLCLSKGGVSQALRFLNKEKLLKTKNKGTMIFYQIDLSSPIVRQSKVFNTVIALKPLIDEIKQYASKAVLFGSCAEGTDSNESDIDILVISNHKQDIENIISKLKTKRKIQLILKSPQEYITLEKKEPVFFYEIEKGKVLWEK